jgi:hypothetical protein
MQGEPTQGQTSWLRRVSKSQMRRRRIPGPSMKTSPKWMACLILQFRARKSSACSGFETNLGLPMSRPRLRIVTGNRVCRTELLSITARFALGLKYEVNAVVPVEAYIDIVIGASVDGRGRSRGC